MTALRIGFAARDITPPLGLPLGGYGARVAAADGILDPLFCRAGFFDDGTAPVAIVVLDLIHVFGSWVSATRDRAARALGLPADRLLIAATHTHAGPAVFRSSMQRDPRIDTYEEQLHDAVLECLAAARQSATRAELSFGSVAVAGIAANRRDPALAVDQSMRVLAACTPAGRLLGVMANFACHPTVLSASNTAYSADLFGAACDGATRALGAPVLLINGAAGDVSTRFTRREQTAGEVRRMGEVLAHAITVAVRAATPLRETAVPLAAVAHSLPVRWREVAAPEVAAAQLHAAFEAWQAARAAGADGGVLRLAESRIEGAQAEVWVSSQGGWPAIFGARQPLAPLHALRCGDLAIVAAPGELFSSASEWLRQRLGPRAFVVGYANDYLGYFIPEADAHAGGYESLVAMVVPACEASLRRELVRLAEAAGCGVQ